MYVRHETAQMKEVVDYLEIFESLPEAVGVCADDGTLLVLNQRARALLGIDGVGVPKLGLGDRDTVRDMKVDRTGQEQEFFLADVRIYDAAISRVSVSLKPLSSGGYRVVLTSKDTDERPANVRLLETLLNLRRHLELFREPDKVGAFFATGLTETFPDFYIALTLVEPDVAFELGTKKSGKFREISLDLSRVCELDGTLIVQRFDGLRFNSEEKEAFEIFCQQLSYAMHRITRTKHLRLVEPILDQLDTIVVICDVRRRIMIANQTFEDLVGTATNGRDILDFFEEEAHPRLRAAAASAMAGTEGQKLTASLEEDSAHATLKLQLTPARSSRDGTDVFGFVLIGAPGEENLAEIERRLHRADHLMKLGELATGVAHELKNPLTSIMNYAGYLLTKYQEDLFDDRDRQRLRHIVNDVERIDAFITDLMMLARPDEGRWEPVNIASVARESVSMCQIRAEEFSATIEVDPGPADLYIHGYENQLRQVFINLVTNAAEAMAEGGGRVHVRVLEHQDVVECRVEDNGRGIAHEVKDKIFEPFITTRHGSGSGLGLAIVRTIVERHRGQIYVDSEIGEGTTFRVLLPKNEG